MFQRKAIPLKVKLQAALIALGLDPTSTEFDHNPALGLRPLNEDGTDTIPPQHDPRYIEPLAKSDHKAKTFGTPATTAGSDIGRIAKVKRILEDQSGGEEFRRKLLAKEPREAKPKGKAWPKRPFPKRAT